MPVRHLIVLVALAASGCVASSDEDARSDESELAASRPILALGDSMTFAWDPLVEPDPAKVDARKYVGFAELLGERLRRPVHNVSCPGEASGSLVDERAEDNGCDRNRAAYRLHYDWSAPTQLEVVRSYLKNRTPALVTLTIGGNDLLLLQKNCELGPLSAPCQLVRLPFYVRGYGENLAKIFGAIRESGYAGPIVALTTYAPDYSDGVATLGLRQMNDELVKRAAETGVRVADGYAVFEARAKAHGGKTCATGLLIPNPDGATCDIHPSAAGHAVLADAIREAAGL
jgi:lysophospholipase L1-like esterase